MKASRRRLEFVAEGFLLQMRKEWAKRQPAAPSPVKSLADYTPEHRSALLNSLQVAITLGGEERDKAFEGWAAKRDAQETPQDTL